jgi:3-oxoacyl-[acyl-carrier protein] reductase
MYKVDLSGSVAVVTGASRGIGHYIAEALHDAGAQVAVTGRHAETIAEAAEDIGERCRGYVCDQRDPKAVKEFAERIERELGPVDTLVNNAGVVYGGVPVVGTTIETWQETIDTNLTGVFLMTQAFLPGMLARERGDIFIVGSTSGKRGDPGWAAYSASKFGLQGFAQSLLHEVRRHNIRVVVLNPSNVDVDHDVGSTEGPGLHLHAADLAATILHLTGLPRRTLVRDLEIWGTNP